MISTAVMMAAVLLLTRRWATPFGTVTVLLTVTNVLMALGFDNDLQALPAVLVAGLVGDLLLRVDAPRYLLAGEIPLVLWSLYFVQVGRLPAGLGWPPEIWSGAIVFAVLIGLVLEAGFEQVARLAQDRVTTSA